MPESFEMLMFLEHLRRRWRVVAVACGVAFLLALIAVLLTPAEYTASARILIEPPAGSDLRGAMAVSPIYLEMLKSYELVASGDQLFLEAIEHFQVPRSKAIDKMKRSVLKVRIPRNTKILEISATLRDPKMAHAFALYVAQQTVKLTRDLSAETERELIAEAQKQVDEAGARLDAAERAWAQSAATSAPGGTAQADKEQLERASAREAYQAAEEQLQQTRATLGTRGERLKIVDPGVVPERPSWPDIPLIIVAVLMTAVVASLLYLALEFSYRLEKPAAPRPVAPLARVKQ